MQRRSREFDTAAPEQGRSKIRVAVVAVLCPAPRGAFRSALCWSVGDVSLPTVALYGGTRRYSVVVCWATVSGSRPPSDWYMYRYMYI